MYLNLKWLIYFLGISHRTKFFLHEIPSDRSLCPVTYFLALAFADNVFEGISKSSQLNKLSIPQDRDSLILPYRSDKTDLPIFRSSLSQSPDTIPQMLTVRQLADWTTELGMRAGYRERLYFYNFRKGQAHKLDGK